LSTFTGKGETEAPERFPPAAPCCRERQATGVADFTTPENQEHPVEKEENNILCRRCDHPITRQADLIAVDGSREHTFFNPAGIVFEIRCFSRAPGCRLEGAPSSDFTWFAGYRWQLALCLSCLTHLGWYFSGADAAGFFGLIRNRLYEP